MSCTCASCKAACRHIPGLFTPLEALRAIRAGHATEMMVVGYRPEKRNGRAWGEQFEAMMPRSYPAWQKGLDPHERRDTHDACGVCVFLTPLSRCRIHSSGFKPMECRLSLCCGSFHVPDGARLGPWQTFVGRAVIEIWRAELKDPAPAARRRVQARRQNRERARP